MNVRSQYKSDKTEIDNDEADLTLNSYKERSKTKKKSIYVYQNMLLHKNLLSIRIWQKSNPLKIWIDL